MNSDQAAGISNTMNRLEGRLQAQIDKLNTTLDNLITKVINLERENEKLLDELSWERRNASERGD
jgi:regulator of replication initiation timing